METHNCKRLRIGCRNPAGPGHPCCRRCECEHPECTNSRAYPKPIVGFSTLRAKGPYIFGSQYEHCAEHLTEWETVDLARSQRQGLLANQKR